jgi:hypothetical protein
MENRFRIAVSETAAISAAVIAIVTWLHLKGGGVVCSVDHVVRGANVGHAVGFAIGGSLLVAVLLPLARTSAGGVATVSLIGVLFLGVSLVFVAADSGTWEADQGCATFLGPTDNRVAEHVYYLYVFWGLSILALAYEAVAALTRDARVRRAQPC